MEAESTERDRAHLRRVVASLESKALATTPPPLFPHPQPVFVNATLVLRCAGEVKRLEVELSERALANAQVHCQTYLGPYLGPYLGLHSPYLTLAGVASLTQVPRRALPSPLSPTPLSLTRRPFLTPFPPSYPPSQRRLFSIDDSGMLDQVYPPLPPAPRIPSF